MMLEYISYKAINEDGTALDLDTLSVEDFEFKLKT